MAVPGAGACGPSRRHARRSCVTRTGGCSSLPSSLPSAAHDATGGHVSATSAPRQRRVTGLPACKARPATRHRATMAPGCLRPRPTACPLRPGRRRAVRVDQRSCPSRPAMWWPCCAHAASSSSRVPGSCRLRQRQPGGSTRRGPARTQRRRHVWGRRPHATAFRCLRRPGRSRAAAARLAVGETTTGAEQPC